MKYNKKIKYSFNIKKISKKKVIIRNPIIFLIIKILIIVFFFLIKKYFEIKVNYSKIQNNLFEINNSISNNSFKNDLNYINQRFIDNKKELKYNNLNNHYHYCFCVMGKMENLYTRELISYYMSIGVDKFVIADNNLPDTEKISDVVKDYIENNTVDIIDIIGKSYDHSQFLEIMYEKYMDKCEWLLFFDFDEYLRMHSEDGKIIGLKEYLSNKIFDKCEAIVFNWLMHDDNNLVYYDNRTSIERFPNPLYKHGANGYVKPMVRGKLNKTIFTAFKTNHCPNKEVITCDSMGKIHSNLKDHINPPLFKYAYLMHFNTRTAEEFILKVKRGYTGNRYEKLSSRVKSFFNKNKFTEEKLKLFEKSCNHSLDDIRKMYNKKK